MTVQVNLKLDESLVKEVDWLLENGHVKTRKEAFERGLLLFLRTCKIPELEERIDRIREGTDNLQSVTEAVVDSHEEES